MARVGHIIQAVLVAVVLLSVVTIVLVKKSGPWIEARWGPYVFYLASHSPHEFDCLVVGDSATSVTFYQIYEGGDLCKTSLVTQAVSGWVGAVTPYKHRCWVLGNANCPTTISIVANLTTGGDYFAYRNGIDAFEFLAPLILATSLLVLVVLVAAERGEKRSGGKASFKAAVV